MSKFTNWTKKPITWGGLFKFSFISFALSMLMTVLTVFTPTLVKKVKNSKKKEDC